MKASRKPINFAVVLALMASACCTVAFAQQPGAARSGAAIVSEPGKANIVQAVDVSATIVAIDKADANDHAQGRQGQRRVRGR